MVLRNCRDVRLLRNASHAIGKLGSRAGCVRRAARHPGSAEMTRLGLIDEAGIAAVREQAQQAMRLAAGALIEQDPDAKPGVHRIRPGL